MHYRILEVLLNALHMFLLLRPLFHSVSFHFMRGSHPLPDQLPGEHTGQPLMQGHEVEPSVQPQETPCRQVPMYQQTAFKKQLAKMQTADLLKPVDHTTPWINVFFL